MFRQYAAEDFAGDYNDLAARFHGDQDHRVTVFDQSGQAIYDNRIDHRQVSAQGQPDIQQALSQGFGAARVDNFGNPMQVFSAFFAPLGRIVRFGQL